MWLITLSKNLLHSLTANWTRITDFLQSSVTELLTAGTTIPIVGDVITWITSGINVTVDGQNYALGDITIIELLFGFALPAFLAFTFVKWLLNLIT